MKPKQPTFGRATGLAGTAAVLCALTLSCDPSTPREKPETAVEPQPASFIGQQKLSMKTLAEQPWFGVLESVDAHDLFSYLSGSFRGGGHSFPVLYFDPAAQAFWVKGPNVATRFHASALDEALEAYAQVLADKGYDMPGQAGLERPTVMVDGKEMVVVSTAEFFPSNAQAQAHFSAEQWDVLYSELGGWQGFTYLSGLAKHSREYPLVVGVGWEHSARLRVLGVDTAEAFEFDQLEQAFAAYRKLASRRIREPRARPRVGDP